MPDTVSAPVLKLAPPLDQASPGLARITAERLRQVHKGYGAAVDDRHVQGELADMALWYLDDETSALDWLWAQLPSRGDRLTCLIRAAALLAAEIDRLLRAGEKPGG